MGKAETRLGTERRPKPIAMQHQPIHLPASCSIDFHITHSLHPDHFFLFFFFVSGQSSYALVPFSNHPCDSCLAPLLLPCKSVVARRSCSCASTAATAVPRLYLYCTSPTTCTHLHLTHPFPAYHRILQSLLLTLLPPAHPPDRPFAFPTKLLGHFYAHPWSILDRFHCRAARVPSLPCLIWPLNLLRLTVIHSLDITRPEPHPFYHSRPFTDSTYLYEYSSHHILDLCSISTRPTSSGECAPRQS